MKAIETSSYGPPDVLRVVDRPEPSLERPDDVRLRVLAAAINPIDWKIRAGVQRGAIHLKLPHVQGLDVCGEVLEVGPAVTRFAVGDVVYGCPDHRRDGAYAEQVVVVEGSLAPKPTRIDPVQAASLPLAGLTAWQCLLPRLAERPGQRVLVQAGSGGVGSLAIQIAKHHGAWVATTCSARNAEMVRGLGADEVVDYRTTHWWEVLEDLDVVLDALGGEERERALQALGRGGRLASIVSGMPTNTKRYGPYLGLVATALGVAGLWLRGRLRGVDAATVIKRNDAAQLEALAALVDDGHVEPVVDRTYPLAEAADAHAYGETGRIRGKVVLVP